MKNCPFPSEMVKVECPYQSYMSGEKKFSHWSGSYSDWMETWKTLFQKRGTGGGDRWKGFRKQTFADFEASGVSIDAQEAFEKALARLDVKGAPAMPENVVCGPVWSVPRYLTGHPLCAIRRPRTNLPPKRWDFAVSFVNFMKAEDVAPVLAKIARAAWAYVEQGGAIEIWMNYTVGYNQPDSQGNQGCIISIKLPLTSIAAIATACSVQMFRGPVVDCLQFSGRREDPGIVTNWLKPGIVLVTGETDQDFKRLETLGIK